MPTTDTQEQTKHNDKIQRLKQYREERISLGLPISTSSKTPLEKLSAHPLSLRRVVDAMCYQCTYDPTQGGWKKQIEMCVITECPAYPVRPMSKRNVNA